MTLPPFKNITSFWEMILRKKSKYWKMLLISVVQFFYLLFGCPMTNFRSLLRKTPDSPNFEAPPLTPPLPPLKKSGAQCFLHLWENIMTQTSSFERDRYVIHMLYIEWLELRAKFGTANLGWSTLSDGIFHTDALKFVIFFLDFGTNVLQVQISL